MSINILKVKAEENFKTGEWAEKKEYFDVAVSRYYYCAYEKIIYISKTREFYKDYSRESGSHFKTINEFNKNLKDKLTGEEKVALSKLKKLRKLRNNADYKEVKLLQNDYYLDFKYPFDDINNILNKLI